MLGSFLLYNLAQGFGRGGNFTLIICNHPKLADCARLLEVEIKGFLTAYFYAVQKVTAGEDCWLLARNNAIRKVSVYIADIFGCLGTIYPNKS